VGTESTSTAPPAPVVRPASANPRVVRSAAPPPSGGLGHRLVSSNRLEDPPTPRDARRATSEAGGGCWPEMRDNQNPPGSHLWSFSRRRSLRRAGSQASEAIHWRWVRPNPAERPAHPAGDDRVSRVTRGRVGGHAGHPAAINPPGDADKQPSREWAGFLLSRTGGRAPAAATTPHGLATRITGGGEFVGNCAASVSRFKQDSAQPCGGVVSAACAFQMGLTDRFVSSSRTVPRLLQPLRCGWPVRARTACSQ